MDKFMKDYRKLLSKLTGVWYSCLVDHHKDRDCFFYIENQFSYSGEEKWCVTHFGYVAEQFEKVFATPYEAYNYLVTMLMRQIGQEVEAAGKLAAQGEDPWCNQKEHWEDVAKRFEETKKDLKVLKDSEGVRF